MIRVAAVGDIHLGTDSAGTYRPHLAQLGDQADMFLLAGDLTKRGTEAEAATLAAELADLPVPTFAVLGNHDHESDAADTIAAELEAAGVTVLEGDGAVCQIDGCEVGIAGVKGFGGGFAGRCGSAFGEREMKAFIQHTEGTAQRLETALQTVGEADLRIALMHYAPIEDTLQGEHCEIYPFLGSYLLAEVVDRAGANLALHGHAHAGAPAGTTPGGTPVRNVALPVIRRSYRVLAIDQHRLQEDPAG